MAENWQVWLPVGAVETEKVELDSEVQNENDIAWHCEHGALDEGLLVLDSDVSLVVNDEPVVDRSKGIHQPATEGRVTSVLPDYHVKYPGYRW